MQFNRDIRPLLTDRCFRCHGPDEKTVEAGLRLDVRSRATGRLESGNRAIVAHSPSDSELWRRVNSSDPDVRMPPEGAGEPLGEAQRALLRQWISEGAPYQRHWSLEPPRQAALPPDDLSWSQHPMDRFVLARLRHEGLQPSPEAGAMQLLRRLSLQLTGLPLDSAEADRLAALPGPDRYQRWVERFLADPGFGERWGHVWLDLARYADSAGYAQDPPRTIWMYRDWVIESLNRNAPFDQFTVEQLAGDLLPHSTDQQLVATAFHRNTMTNSEGGTDDEEFRVAAVVDRVNTTMQVWMGMTMGCAQCHNHKYDPITQEEYYRFLAIFNNTQDADQGDESPVLRTWTEQELRQRQQLESELAQVVGQREALLQAAGVAPDAAAGPLRARFIRIELPGDQPRFLSLAEVQAFVGSKNVALQGKATQSSTAFAGPAELAIDGNTDGHYETARSTTHTDNQVEPWWEVDLGEVLTLEKLVIWNRLDGLSERLNGFRILLLDDQRQPVWAAQKQAAPSPSLHFDLPQDAGQLSREQRDLLRKLARRFDPEARALDERAVELERRLKALAGVTTPIMRELTDEKSRETHIHLRGDFRKPGQLVQPGTPAAFPPLPRDARADRLGVALWLTDRGNPLTARVLVNRCWEQLFGVGLVVTSEDMGVQGEQPSHPELLDYLAVEFMEHDWDLKWLLRTIVCSATYRQASTVSAELAALDPDNRLLARGPRFRLSAELVRDQALAIGGLLSHKMYGPSVQPPRPNLGLRAAFGGSTDWESSPGEDRYRRGLYTSWRRTTPYPSMTTFDAPSREVCTIRRIRTNTPLQALVTLNDPVFVEAAQALARSADAAPGDLSTKIATVFRRCLTRFPSHQEVARLLRLWRDARQSFAGDPKAARLLSELPLGTLPAGADPTRLAAWTVVCNVLLNLDETLAPP